MPIRANAPTIIIPPSKVPRHFVGKGQTPVATGAMIPENHALAIIANGAVMLTLSNPGDDDIIVPLPAGFWRVIVTKQIGDVTALAENTTRWSQWIEDLRAMEPWICAGEFRP
jgi:DNA/RNA endonuclease G (NUC1)